MISLAEKQTYQSYPKRMLQMRARALAIRDMFPDVLKGIAIREELEELEIETTATTVQETPIPLPKPKEKKADGSKPVVESDAPTISRSASDGDRKEQAQPGHQKVSEGEGVQTQVQTESESTAKNGEGKPEEKPRVGRPAGSKNKPKPETEQQQEAVTTIAFQEAAKVYDTAPAPKSSWLDETLPILDRVNLWLDEAPIEEINEMKFLRENMKDCPKNTHIALCQKYNDRRKRDSEAVLQPQEREVGRKGESPPRNRHHQGDGLNAALPCRQLP